MTEPPFNGRGFCTYSDVRRLQNMGIPNGFRRKRSLSVDEAALLISGAINEAAVQCLLDVKRISHEESPDQTAVMNGSACHSLSIEVLFMFYNAVDRLAFANLEAPKRTQFMHLLSTMVVDLCINAHFRAPADQKEDLKDALLGDLDRANLEYGGLAMSSDTGSVMTVFDKLAQSAAAEFGLPNDRELIGLFHVSAMGHYYKLRPGIEGILRSVR
jgi:hypothetical protein